MLSDDSSCSDMHAEAIAVMRTRPFEQTIVLKTPGGRLRNLVSIGFAVLHVAEKIHETNYERQRKRRWTMELICP